MTDRDATNIIGAIATAVVGALTIRYAHKIGDRFFRWFGGSGA